MPRLPYAASELKIKTLLSAFRSAEVFLNREQVNLQQNKASFTDAEEGMQVHWATAFNGISMNYFCCTSQITSLLLWV